MSTLTRRKALSDVENYLEAKMHRGPMAVIPLKEVCLDTVGHFATYAEKKGHRRFPNCTSITRVMCRKFKVHLCFSLAKTACFSFIMHEPRGCACCCLEATMLRHLD